MQRGKIGAVGVSNVDGPQLREALDVDTETRVGWVQNSYSLLDRDAEREVLPLCAERGLGFTPFSPLAGGWLTGKYARGAEAPPGSRMTMRPEPYAHFVENDAVWRGLDGLAAAAAERGTSQAALALALAARRPAGHRSRSSARGGPSTLSPRSTHSGSPVGRRRSATSSRTLRTYRV